MGNGLQAVPSMVSCPIAVHLSAQTITRTDEIADLENYLSLPSLMDRDTSSAGDSADIGQTVNKFVCYLSNHVIRKFLDRNKPNSFGQQSQTKKYHQ